MKSFKGFRAVDGLDLTIERGMIYGFLGPNGCGKTTAMRMLTAFSRRPKAPSKCWGFPFPRMPRP